VPPAGCTSGFLPGTVRGVNTQPKLVVPHHLQRSRYKDQAVIQQSARELLAYMAVQIGYEDLRGLAVLDVGCGVKFTEAILNDGMPIGRYVGVDAYAPVVEFLRENVDDPRFEFAHADFYNERYNPRGAKMTAGSRLPIPDEQFDIICLFSVFTHLDPHDYRVMLQMLRRYAKPDGRLFYTLNIDELTEGGHGLIDAFSRVYGDDVVGRTEDYRDFNPADPLRNALYTEAYARELIEGTGWSVVRLSPPVPFAQHQFTLQPA
jgi:SAM-dependent methyltransferase